MEKIRILHIIGGMNRCGAETFLMNVFRNIDRSKFEFYFLCYGDKKYDYEEEIKNLGGKLIRIDSLKKVGMKRFYKNIKNILETYNINIIHAHTYYNSAIPLMVAKKNGIKLRIVHAHNTASENKSNLIKKIYNIISKIIININANCFLACSEEAGKTLFFKSKKIVVVENGIELKRFEFNDEKRRDLREKYNIENDDLVIGHVGRFEEQKNHVFLVKVFAEILKGKENSKLLLAGNGSEFDNIKNICKKFNIDDKVIFLGNIPNINEILNAMDVFVFPSIFEGLGIVLIEAQANGLTCFASTEVPKEADISGRVKYISLNKNEEEWAKEILHTDLERYKIDFEKCRYDIRNTVNKINKIYEDFNKE